MANSWSTLQVLDTIGQTLVDSAGDFWLDPGVPEDELLSSAHFLAGRLPSVNLGSLNPVVKEGAKAEDEMGFICQADGVSVKRGEQNEPKYFLSCTLL